MVVYMIQNRLDLGVDSNFLKVRDHKQTKIIHPTLTADLESQVKLTFI